MTNYIIVCMICKKIKIIDKKIYGWYLPSLKKVDKNNFLHSVF